MMKPRVMDGLDSKFKVNEEYLKAFRSKSYLDISSKVKFQLKKTTANYNSDEMSANDHHLSEFLVEPQQKSLADMFPGSKLPHLLLDYFEASWHACTVCESLLQCIRQARANHRKVKRVVRLSKRVWAAEAEHANSSINNVEHQRLWRRVKLLGELDSYGSLNNPFAAVSPAQFREIHDRHRALFRRLKSRSRMMRRRAKIVRLCRRAAGFGLVVTYAAIATSLMVLAVHSIVGVLAAPGAVGCWPWVIRTVKRVRVTGGGRKSRIRQGGERMRRREGTATHEQLDVAGKGMYIMINDLDTMSRLVRRLHDQVEHGKAIADICVRSGRGEVLREVVKELEAQEKCYLDQLEELENHIKLCFLNINRSRNLLIQQMIHIVNNGPTTTTAPESQ